MHLLRRATRYLKNHGKALGNRMLGKSSQANTNASNSLQCSNFHLRYAPVRLLEGGGNGTVHLYRNTNKGTLVAVKTIYHDDPQSPPNEVRILQLLGGSHPHIVQYHTMLSHPALDFHVQLVFEYCQFGDLVDYVNSSIGRDRDVPEPFIWHVFKHVAAGLSFMHLNSVVHGDIKSANILMAAPRDGEIYPLPRIADFGTAQVNPPYNVPYGHHATMGWQPPEWEHCHGPAADVWGLGSIVHELAHKCLPQRAIEPPPAMDSMTWFESSGKTVPPGTERVVWYKQFCFYMAFHPAAAMRLDRPRPSSSTPAPVVYSRLLNYMVMRTLDTDADRRISTIELTSLLPVLDTVARNLRGLEQEAILSDFDDGRDGEWKEVSFVTDSQVLRQLFCTVASQAKHEGNMEMLSWGASLVKLMNPRDQPEALLNPESIAKHKMGTNRKKKSGGGRGGRKTASGGGTKAATATPEPSMPKLKLKLKLPSNPNSGTESDDAPTDWNALGRPKEFEEEEEELPVAEQTVTTRRGRQVRKPQTGDDIYGSDFDRLLEQSSDQKVDDDDDYHYEAGADDVQVFQVQATRKSGRPSKNVSFAPEEDLDDGEQVGMSSDTITRSSPQSGLFLIPPDPEVYMLIEGLCGTSEIFINLFPVEETATPGVEKPYTAKMLIQLYLVGYENKHWNVCDLVADTWIRAFHQRRERAERDTQQSIWRRNKVLENRKRELEEAARKIERIGGKAPKGIGFDPHPPDYDLPVNDPLLEADVTLFNPALLTELYKHTPKLCGARLLWADAMTLCGAKMEQEIVDSAKNGTEWPADLLFDIMQTSLRMLGKKLTLKIEESTEGCWCKRYHEHVKHGLPCYRELAWLQVNEEDDGDEQEGGDGDDMDFESAMEAELEKSFAMDM
ncbi:hypothetical protein N0V83_003452 [Neocucurbitaria cava]|uniref:non-specific serine/threonine protein kinase n=1 Tax=Neocucurbitaria cava TaxID=798079 RepID=A0A9W8YD88_9PLEO|nr:hypothetical protein N0V83_003452 [Neocucurbitaria cava]